MEGDDEQNEAKAKSGSKKKDIGDTGAKDYKKKQNQARAKGGIKKEDIDDTGIKDGEE